MKSFMMALAAMIVIGIGASTILNGSYQKAVDQAFATTSVRVDRSH